MYMTPEQFHELWNLAIKFHRSKLKQLTIGNVFNFQSVVPNKIKSTIDPKLFEQVKELYQSLYQEFVSNKELQDIRWSNPGKYMSAWADFLASHEHQVMSQLGITKGAYR